MRLFGITILRNEADIVEAWVRHNLTVLDGMAVVDHGSMDGTSDILDALQREGLPLRVMRDASPGFFQAERMTALARQTLVRERADFTFVIDADEFIKAESRASLERALAEIPPDAHATEALLRQ
ncbi:MAG TPA: glycosyltransferase family 2 protein [Casimicrobiaceae bacterium]